MLFLKQNQLMKHKNSGFNGGEFVHSLAVEFEAHIS